MQGTDHAIEIMYQMAQLPEGTAVSICSLCEAADVPESLGEALVRSLAQAGLIRKSGLNRRNLSLRVPASEVTMAQIIRACSAESVIEHRTLKHDPFKRPAHDAVLSVWAELDALVWERLDSLTLDRAAAVRPPLPDTSRIVAGYTGLSRTA